MNTGILDYGAGNLASVRNALERLGKKYFIAREARELERADRIIFPGVGHAGHAMRLLQQYQTDRLLKTFQGPLLGICLGMQLLGSESEEGDVAGLGVLEFQVKKFSPGLKVPHMGWNHVMAGANPLFKGIPDQTCFYFVHSYYAGISKETIARCHYGIPFAAAVQRGNYYGVQFHPEKSAAPGMQLLENFFSI
jgi:imidazole glycerol-phosphate synthase subunit HisH